MRVHRALLGYVPAAVLLLDFCCPQSQAARPLVTAFQDEGLQKEPGVCLHQFTNRFGNQFIMLQQAVEAAQLLSLPVVRLPKPCKPGQSCPDDESIRSVLHLEEDAWRLGTGRGHSRSNLTVECVADCKEWESCSFANGSRINMPAAGRHAEPELMRKLLTGAGRLRCGELHDFKRGDNSTLTMHMRSGDALKQTWNQFRYHKTAPCQFWVQAFNKGNFSSALIVTEKDLEHPCIDFLQRALPGKVTVQSSSVLEDFCSILHSEHLAVSFGTLGPSLVELSDTIRSVYAPQWCSDTVMDIFSRNSLLEKCVEVEFPDYPEKFESWPAKHQYLLSYPAEKVDMRDKPCGHPTID